MMNGDIQLLKNVDLKYQCGGDKKSCDEYFYFCVDNNTLYFKSQSSLVRNGKIRIEISKVEGRAVLAGLVFLKGSIGESRKLISSNTNDSLYFDPVRTHWQCSGEMGLLQEIWKELQQKALITEELQTANNNTSQKLIKIQELIVNGKERPKANDIEVKLQRIEQSITNIGESRALTSNGDQEELTDATLHQTQLSIHENFDALIKKASERMDMQFEKLQSELQDNVVTLEAELRRGSRRMQADIENLQTINKIRFDKIQAEQERQRFKTFQISEQLLDIQRMFKRTAEAKKTNDGELGGYPEPSMG
jgi:hypothetical protein